MRQLVLTYYLIATALLGGDDRIIRICCQVVATPSPQVLANDDDDPTVVDFDGNSADDAARKRTKFTRTRAICDLILVREALVGTAVVVLPRFQVDPLIPIARPLFTWFCLLLI